MNFFYVFFIVLFVGVLTVFSYLDCRRGMKSDLPLLLKVLVPMLLAGIIVKITQIIGIREVIVKYIIGGIGAIIFYIVLYNVFKVKKDTYHRRLNILDYFFGFLIGLGRGWLYFGFFTLYIHKIFNLIFVDKRVLNAVILPIKWVLFLDFL